MYVVISWELILIIIWCLKLNDLIDLFTDIQTVLNDLGNGLDETTVLLVMVLFDTILAVSWRLIRRRENIVSSKAIHGIIRNVLVSLIPLIIQRLTELNHHHIIIYQLISAVFTLVIGFAILQSIIANLELNGINPPKFLIKFYGNQTIDNEKNSKERK